MVKVLIFVIGFLIFTTSIFADTSNIKTIDYSFSNPDSSLITASQIMTKVLPRTSEEVIDPEKFYPLVTRCYQNQLGKIFYHFVPAANPHVAYMWFSDQKGKCYFGAYFVSNIPEGTKRSKICPMTDLRYKYLFKETNLKSVINFEKTGVRDSVFGIFAFKAYVCLDGNNLYTEQLQSMFPSNY